LLRCPSNKNKSDKYHHQNCSLFLIFIYYVITGIFALKYFHMGLEKNNSVVSALTNVNVAPVVVDYSVSQITPYVFVTAEDTARQFATLFSNGIGCVINVADELPQMFFPPQSGIESLKYPILDLPTFPASNYFDIVADRIAANTAANRRTLLYCHHGRSRSITFILAYLIKHHRLPLPTAYALVKGIRQIALPNTGFWSQLITYEFHQRNQQYSQQQRNQQYNQPQRNQQYNQRQQPQQLLHPSPILKNVQDSLAYGQQVLTKISTGFEHMLTHGPFVNAITGPNMSTYSRSTLPVQHRVLRRRPTVLPASHLFRLPPGVHVKRLF
jgi:atypical dual specificity phosphatase